MSIHEMHVSEHCNITDDLRRKDHVIVIGNEEGLYGDLYDEIGFSLLHMLNEDYWATLLSSAKGKVGDVVSWYDEAEYVWFHCIIGYSVGRGWEPSGWEKITQAYDQIWTKHEDDYVRPFRTTWVSRGKMRTHGQVAGNIVMGAMTMADTDCRLAVYTRMPQ